MQCSLCGKQQTALSPASMPQVGQHIHSNSLQLDCALQVVFTCVSKKAVARVGCAHNRCHYWPTVHPNLQADAPVQIKVHNADCLTVCSTVFVSLKIDAPVMSDCIRSDHLPLAFILVYSFRLTHLFILFCHC